MVESKVGSMQVLVTGATGFLGSAIAQKCSLAGHTVVSVGRQVQPKQPLPNYRRVDLCEPATLAPALQGIDCVVHAAGHAHQFGSVGDDPTPFMSVNVDGTIALLRAAVDAGVHHFVLLSSVSVYGSSASSEAIACQPRGPYAQSKYVAEQRAMEMAAAHGLRLTILRLATCYGEGDPGNVQRLMRSIDRRRFVWIGSGANRKSLIHKDDVARACLAVVDSGGTGIATYNVSAPPRTMREVVEALATALGRRVPRWHIPAPLARGVARNMARLAGGRSRIGALPATVEKWLTDDVYVATAFEQMFNFRAAVSLTEGLRREVAWYRAQGA